MYSILRGGEKIMERKVIKYMSLSELVEELETLTEVELRKDEFINIKWEILNLSERVNKYQKVCEQIKEISKRISQLENGN